MVAQGVLDRRYPDIRQSPAGKPAAIDAANFTTPRRTGSGSASIAAKTAVSRLANVLPPELTDFPDQVRTTRSQPLCDQHLQTDAALFLIER